MARPRVHDDALRRRLLEVSSEVISAAGAGGLTVRDVAARAETSASAVYALFGGRDELVRAVAGEAFRRFAERLSSVPIGPDAGADLLALGLAYRESALAAPHFYRVMFGALSAEARDHTRGPATSEPTFGVLRAAVARVLATERAGAAAPDVALEVALGLWGLVHGLVGLELAGLLPGTAEERSARYERVLRDAGRPHRPAASGPS